MKKFPNKQSVISFIVFTILGLALIFLNCNDITFYLGFMSCAAAVGFLIVLLIKDKTEGENKEHAVISKESDSIQNEEKKETISPKIVSHPTTTYKNKKLTVCKTCGKDVAKSAITCPHCGAKLGLSSREQCAIISIVLSTVFLCILLLSFASCKSNVKTKSFSEKQSEQQAFVQYSNDASLSFEDYSVLCNAYDYNDIATQPDKYIGKKIKCAGNVVRIREDGNKISLLLNCDGMFYVKYYRYNEDETNIQANDYLTIYGELGGTQTYIDAATNEQNTLPLLNMVYWEINSTTSANNNPCTISLSEFNSLQTDMSYEQVCEIIGGYGTLSSQLEILDTKTTVYSWEGSNSPLSSAVITFQNDKLVSKTQIGLK